MRAEDEAEIEELLARQRIHSFRRALIFGLVSLGGAVGGLLCVLYGRSLEIAQAHSDVHFAFPSRLMLVGALVTVVGTLGAIASFVTGIRLRTRRGL